MTTELSLGAAFAIGLAGAGHCLGMCGGIAAAMNLGGASGKLTTTSYHLGRISSYTLLGAAIGWLAGTVNLAVWTLALRYLAGLLLVGMGLYIAQWWMGMQYLERIGSKLWQPVQRLSGNWLPPQNSRQSFVLGLCWGLMPCGLIYSSLAWAATAANALESALLMLCFGLGTLPAMLATSLGAQQLQTLLRRRGLKIVIAVMLIISGLWTLYLTAAHSGHMIQAANPGNDGMDHSHMHH